jgi:hypothetical protein
MAIHDAFVLKRNVLQKKIALQKELEGKLGKDWRKKLEYWKKEKNRGAVVIQRTFRKWNALKIVNQMKAEQDGALMIQKTIRKRNAQKEVNQMKAETDGAVRIQKICRKKKAQEKLDQLKQEKEKILMNEKMVMKSSVIACI